MFFQMNVHGDKANGIIGLRETCDLLKVPYPDGYVPQREDGYCFHFEPDPEGLAGVNVNHVDPRARLARLAPRISFGPPLAWNRGSAQLSVRLANDALETVDSNAQLFQHLATAWASRVVTDPAPADKIAPITLTPPQKDPFNQQAVKRFVFSETGNIMIATTVQNDGVIAKEVMDVFAEVSVFFAAMTRAMSTTINPQTGKPYSIYDYQAIDNIVRGSGMFVQVTGEDVNYTMESWGVDFSKDLIQSLLGLATGAGELAFASSLVASVGERGLELRGSTNTSESKVGSIIFICEYLLGVPLVSAMVVYIDIKKNERVLKLGPCISGNSSQQMIYMHKDTYLFVTPDFIKKFAGSLLAVERNVDYMFFVDYLRDIVAEKPMITGVATMQGDPAPSALQQDTTYVITGVFLLPPAPTPPKSAMLDLMGDPVPTGPVLKMMGDNVTATVKLAQLQFDTVTFSITGAQATACAIGLYANESDPTPYAMTPQAFTVL